MPAIDLKLDLIRKFTAFNKFKLDPEWPSRLISSDNNAGRLWQHTHFADRPTNAAWDGNYC